MRHLLWTSLVLLFLVGPSASSAAPVFQEEAVCQVPQNYLEAVDENEFSLLKVLSMVHSNSSPLQRDSGFGSYYMMLLSSRHYHEGQHERLPQCARDYNRAFVETIAASQDALALTLAWQENPDTSRYESRLTNAVEHRDQKWQELAQLSQVMNLTAAEE